MRMAGHARCPRRIAVFGILCLFVQLALCSPALPLVTAFAAWMDGGHSVLFVAGVDEIRLELRHDSKTLEAVSPPGPAHHHGRVLQAMMVFAEPASSSDPDHILAFASTEFAARNPRSTWMRSREGFVLRERPPALPAPLPWFAGAPCWGRIRCVPASASPPGPGVSVSRTVVLLV